MRFRFLPAIFDLQKERRNLLWTPWKWSQEGGKLPPRPLGSVCHMSFVHEAALLRHKRRRPSCLSV